MEDDRFIFRLQKVKKRIACYLTWIYAVLFQAKTIELPDGLLQDEFEKTTVNMSTYLVAFIVADFSPVRRNVSETLVSLI